MTACRLYVKMGERLLQAITLMKIWYHLHFLPTDYTAVCPHSSFFPPRLDQSGMKTLILIHTLPQK